MTFYEIMKDGFVKSPFAALNPALDQKLRIGSIGREGIGLFSLGLVFFEELCYKKKDLNPCTLKESLF